MSFLLCFTRKLFLLLIPCLFLLLLAHSFTKISFADTCTQVTQNLLPVPRNEDPCIYKNPSNAPLGQGGLLGNDCQGSGTGTGTYCCTVQLGADYCSSSYTEFTESSVGGWSVSCCSYPPTETPTPTPTPAPLPDCNTGGSCWSCVPKEDGWDSDDNWVSYFNTCSANGTKTCSRTSSTDGSACISTYREEPCNVDQCVSEYTCNWFFCVSDPPSSSLPVYSCNETLREGWKTACVNGTECPVGATDYTAAPATACTSDQVCCILPPISISTPTPTPTSTPTPTYTILVTVFVDINDNGARDAGEVGKENVMLTLSGTANAAGQTDASGMRTFREPAGTYAVDFAIPSGYRYATNQPPHPRTNITLSASSTNQAVNFGIIPPETCTSPSGLNGTCDYNANNTYTLNFSWDNNPVCTGYDIDITDRTDTSRNKTAAIVPPPASYSTAGILNHTYEWTVTGKSEGPRTDSVPGNTFECLAPEIIPIGITPPPGGSTPTPTPSFGGGTGPFFTVTGFVWEDPDDDHVKDAGEVCYEGEVRVALVSLITGLDAQPSVNYTQDKNCNNKYRFKGVSSGTYNVALGSADRREGIDGYDSTYKPQPLLGWRSWMKSFSLVVP